MGVQLTMDLRQNYTELLISILYIIFAVQIVASMFVQLFQVGGVELI